MDSIEVQQMKAQAKEEKARKKVRTLYQIIRLDVHHAYIWKLLS